MTDRATSPQTDPLDGLGAALQRLREGCNLSPNDLADAAALPVEAVHRLESRVGEASLGELGRVLTVLDRDFADLAEGMGQRRPSDSEALSREIVQLRSVVAVIRSLVDDANESLRKPEVVGA